MLQISIPRQFSAECAWLCSILIEDHLGLKCQVEASDVQAFIISYDHRCLILPDFFFCGIKSAWLKPASLPKLSLPEWDVPSSGLDAILVERTIPILYGEAGFKLDESGNGHLKLDVFGSAFFMLSRYEEAISTVRDSHDRFPAKASIAYKAGFLDRPIIDEYVEILWAAMQRVWPGLERKQCTYRTLLSHDVDWPSYNAFHSPMKVLRSSAANLLKRGDLIGAIRTPWQWLNSRDRLHPSDPYNTFDWLMDLSDKHGLKSSFYFICGCTDPTKDTDYNLEHPAIRRLLRNQFSLCG